MWKIIKISHQSGLELMTTRMIDEVLSHCPYPFIANIRYSSRISKKIAIFLTIFRKIMLEQIIKMGFGHKK